jgi:hypothetical protein
MSPNAAPISAALAAHLSAAQSLMAPDVPNGALPAAGAGSARTASGFAPAPGIPPADVAPLEAPRPRAPTAAPPPSYDAPRSAVMQHEAVQEGSVPSSATAAAPRSNRWLAVVLVVLAAATAAITVYFLLPLLT